MWSQYFPPCYGLETDWKTICVESGAGSVRIDEFFKVGKESWIYESCENPQKTIHRSDWSFTRDKFSFLRETIEKFRKRSKRNHGKIDFLKIGKESRNKYISHVRIPLFFFVNVIAIKVQSFHVVRNWEADKIIHRSDRSILFPSTIPFYNFPWKRQELWKIEEYRKARRKRENRRRWVSKSSSHVGASFLVVIGTKDYEAQEGRESTGGKKERKWIK